MNRWHKSHWMNHDLHMGTSCCHQPSLNGYISKKNVVISPRNQISFHVRFNQPLPKRWLVRFDCDRETGNRSASTSFLFRTAVDLMGNCSVNHFHLIMSHANELNNNKINSNQICVNSVTFTTTTTTQITGWQMHQRWIQRSGRLVGSM